MTIMANLVDVYPYRVVKGVYEFFIGKRSRGRTYAGQWRMVGGKVQQDETAWQAALRELKEELNVVPIHFWAPPTLNQFYEHSSDTVHHIPVFAAALRSTAQIKLNGEHSEYKWITIDQTERYIYWPEQLRILNLIHNIITSEAIIEDWVIPINK